MVLCPETISKVRIGKLSPYTYNKFPSFHHSNDNLSRIETLRLIRDFFGITFKLEPDPENKTIICTCRGLGYKNLSKKSY